MRNSAITVREKSLADLYMIAEFVQVLAKAVQSSPADTLDPELRQFVQTAFDSLEMACRRGNHVKIPRPPVAQP